MASEQDAAEGLERLERMRRRADEAYQSRYGKPMTYAALAERLGETREVVRSRMYGRRPLQPKFVRDLARVVGLGPLDFYVDLGWLDDSDIEDARAHVEGAGLRDGESETTAIRAAVHGLLADERMRARYQVEVSTLESAGAFPLTTDEVARFSLRSGARPLPLEEAQRAARLARVRQELGDTLLNHEPEYCAIRLELSAFLTPLLRRAGQYTWQGEPGSVVWRRHRPEWPAHILVQDVLAGVSRPVGPDPWLPDDQRPLVVIGGRYSTGSAAAVIAEAVGWQFVVVHSGTTIQRGDTVDAVRRDWSHGPAEAWSESALHIRQHMERGTRWPVVLLVRPHSFLSADGEPDESALEQLRHTEARIIYGRPARAALDWWRERQTGLSPNGEYGPTAQAVVELLDKAFVHVERVLVQRARAHGAGSAALQTDLVQSLQPPAGALKADRPELPAALVDAQLLFARDVIKWLSSTSRHRGTAASIVRPGALARAWDAS